jgi:hypothetical protein
LQYVAFGPIRAFFLRRNIHISRNQIHQLNRCEPGLLF